LAPSGENALMNILNRILYSPFLVQMVVTRRCNLACGYCSEFDKTSEPIPFETLTSRMKKLKSLGTLFMEFTGGEPLMHPQILDLIRFSRKSKFLRTQLISNAYYLTREKVEALNEAGLQDLQISIDGVKPNKTTVKVLEPLRERLKTVSQYAKFRVVLNSVIGSAPPEEVLEVIDFAKELGFIPRVQFMHDAHGQILLTQEQLNLVDEVRKRLERRFMEGGDYRMRLITEGEAPFKCRAGSRYLYVDEFGMVRWCSQTRDGFGKKLEKYSLADLKEQFFTSKSCHPHCTIGCVRSNSRFDEFRKQE
jgi:MoaA/NifB/PqqE/SkfB family radical SAM enzyme